MTFKLNNWGKAILVFICLIASVVGFMVKLPAAFRHHDKFLHAAFYFLAAAFLNILFSKGKILRHVLFFVLLYFFSVAIEYAQEYSNSFFRVRIHGRYDPEDVKYNLIGLITFSALWILYWLGTMLFRSGSAKPSMQAQHDLSERAIVDPGLAQEKQNIANFREIKTEPMRKLIFAINLTLDGCCDHTKGVADAEIHDFFTELMEETDLFVYGRKTYELMVPFWPDMAKERSGPTKAMNDFAVKFAAVDKLVFSRTLTNVEDSNTRIVGTDLKEEIMTLKQQPGKSIMTGGVSIPEQLIELGLVDEFIFVVQPVVVGEGRRLLDKAILPEQLMLRLVESKVFKSGGIALRYVK